MRAIFTATALSLIIAAPAGAQDQTHANPPRTDIVFAAPTVSVDGYERYDYDANTFEMSDLEGEAVYSSTTNERIGDVNEVYPGAGDTPTYIGMRIGGFIGIGDRDIAVPLDQVSLYRGDDWRVYIEATEAEIEAYPEYDM